MFRWLTRLLQGIYGMQYRDGYNKIGTYSIFFWLGENNRWFFYLESNKL